MLKGLILGIVLGVLLILGGVYFYFSSGRAPVATSAPAMPFEKTFARIGLHAYLEKLPHPEPQVPTDEAGQRAGEKCGQNTGIGEEGACRNFSGTGDVTFQ